MTESSVKEAITIRTAESDDFEWVAELMDRALRPFYGGDHRAHAQRIFDTHMRGGVDEVGHFSAGQYMFIAELGGERAGLIHVVQKKQDTVKISPLIVATNLRGVCGVGSALIEHAESFALRVGARQLYCTVAEPNTKALQFFLRKGFRITGTAKDHYKQGVNEHMLYKEIGQEPGFDAPSVSVVPFDEHKHATGVRELILSEMTANFSGVNDDWVDALFAGYGRRNDGDVNSKYKIIFIAESGGTILGVAGATPKKGDPIKLMPLLASTEEAFEALVVDLQGLLADYGHKLYVHLVPRARQVMLLQRHGWQLEGVFPGGYAPDSVVQQWGHNLKKEGTNVRMLRIKRPYYDAIMAGTKTLEVRVGYSTIRRLRAGELLQLAAGRVSGVVRIKAIREYHTFEDLLATESWESIVPQVKSKQEALELLRQIYDSEKEALGVFVLEVEKVNS